MLAAGIGLSAAVPETPTAPPLAARPQRLVAKQQCGAAVAVLNHVPRPSQVAAFVAAARAAGLTIPVIAAVAVYTDEHSAAVLQGLPGLRTGRRRRDPGGHRPRPARAPASTPPWPRRAPCWPSRGSPG